MSLLIAGGVRCSRQSPGPASPEQSGIVREDLFTRFCQLVGDRRTIRGTLISDPIGESLGEHLCGDFVFLAFGSP